MSKSRPSRFSTPPRSSPRVHTISGIILNYEGQPELTYVRSPDVSTKGMFVNTTRQFPEGAILNVRFRLALTGASIAARGEVRYCLPGVGIGLEFIALDAPTRRKIEREVALNADGKRPAPKKSASTARRAHPQQRRSKKR